MDLGGAVKGSDDDWARALDGGLERAWVEWEKQIIALVPRSFRGYGD